MWFLVSGAAFAYQSYLGRVCVDYSTHFLDDRSEDFLKGDTAPARGAWVRLRQNAAPPLQAIILYEGYVEDDGEFRGCTPEKTLSNLFTYEVKITSKAYVNGNYIQVLDLTTAPPLQLLYTEILDGAFVPSATGPWNFTTANGPLWSKEAAAAAFTFHRHTGGLTGYTLKIDSTHAGAGVTSSYSSSDQMVHIIAAHGSRKFVMAHEIGHWMMDRFNALQGLVIGTSASTDGCESIPDDQPKHGWVSKEFQSAAAAEGWAQFVSVITFNDVTDADCWANGTGTDFNYDGGSDSSNSEIRCYGDPLAGGAPDDADQLGAGIGLGTCTGTLGNRGTELDWARFFWDLVHDEGMTFEELGNVIDDANPHSWNRNDSGPANATVAQHFYDAMSTYYFGEYFNQAARNGANR